MRTISEIQAQISLELEMGRRPGSNGLVSSYDKCRGMPGLNGSQCPACAGRVRPPHPDSLLSKTPTVASGKAGRPETSNVIYVDFRPQIIPKDVR